MRRSVVAVTVVSVALSCLLAGTATAASGRPPVPGPVPGFVSDLGGADSEVLLIPGTGDPTGVDQVARTYRWWGHRPVTVVDYPAAFGIKVGNRTFRLIGDRTYDDSAALGVQNAEKAAASAVAAGHAVILNGFSQGANVAMLTAAQLTRRGVVAPENLTVVLGADPRFPETGLDTIAPNVLPGVTTGGPRDPSAPPGVRVVSYCIRGDSVCGTANPIADPLAAAFYFGPGYYIHAFMYPKVGRYRQVKNWRSGNTEYYVYDGGNPVGIMLRDLGIPVDRKFDDAVSKAIPVPMPGVAATRNGTAVPTPRMLTQRKYAVGTKAAPSARNRARRAPLRPQYKRPAVATVRIGVPKGY